MLSLITVPINVYGIYLIWFKSDKALKNAKWCMLNSQVWTTWCNLLLTTFIVPLMFFPVAGGYGLGLFSWLGMSIFWQMVIGVGSVAQIGASMVIIFENQQNHLVSTGFKLKTKRSRRVFMIVNQIAGFTFFIPTIFKLPDQEIIKKEVLEWFDCPPPEFFTLPIFILADNPLFISFLLSIILTFYLLEAVFFISHCAVHLIFTSRKLSDKTKALQRKFFISVCVQIFLPFSIIGIPVAYFIFSIATGYHNQMLNNFCIILIGLHGSLATISTILVYESMRKQVCCYKKNRVFSSYQST